jgi:hypothetical protein
MKTTATTEAVSSPPEENEHWNTKWRRTTSCAGKKPAADLKKDLQIQEAGRKSRKPPTPFVGIKPYGKSQSKLARYFLRSLERTAEGQKNPEWVVNDDASINLEHILPGTPSVEWSHIQERDIESHSNRLGNLVLLQAALNVEIDKHDFATKKKAYKQSTFLLTSHVAEFKEWGVKEIESRQKTLAAYAVKTWKIAG